MQSKTINQRHKQLEIRTKLKHLTDKAIKTAPKQQNPVSKLPQFSRLHNTHQNKPHHKRKEQL